MKIKQILSTAIAVSMMSSALPMIVSAENNEEPLVADQQLIEATSEPTTDTTTELFESAEDLLSMRTMAVSDGKINMLYEENYNGGVVGNVQDMEQTTSYANAADPKDSSNKVLRIYSKTETKDNYQRYINARIGGTAAINPWGGGKWGSTYEVAGALENIPLVYEMDIYVPSDIKDHLKKDYNADLIFGPLMSTGNPGHLGMAYEMGVDTSTAGQGNPGGAEAWLGKDNWAKKCAFSLDTWYKFMWVITGEGDSTKVSVFMSNNDGATYTTLYDNVTAEKKYNRSTTLMHGISIASRGPVAVGSDTTGVFVDNVKIYQVIEQDAEFEVGDTTNVDMATGIVVDLKHEIEPSKLSEAFSIEKKIDGEYQVVTKAKVSAVDGEPSKVLISSDILEGKTDYTIFFDGYTFGTLYTRPNSIDITTKAPTTMKVSADTAENASVPAGANTISLFFSQNVKLEDVEAALTLVDEDNIPQDFTVNQEDDRKVSVSMDLVELCGFTLRLDDTLLSDTDPRLPLESVFTLNFRTEAEVEVSPEDPYQPPVNGDTEIVTTDDGSNTVKWWSSDFTTTAFTAVENGVKTEITNSDAAVKVIPKATKIDDYYELSSKKYPHESVMTFEYDLKLPDLTTTSSLSSTISFGITSDHSQDETWKDIGGWGPTFDMTYDENGLSAQKGSAGSTKVMVYRAEELVGKETIHIKIKADVQTGIITIVREDGELYTVDMNKSVGWGESDKYMNWSPYMHIRNIQFSCKAQRRQTAEFEVSNISIKRVTKTLGVDSANFSHGEYYVDTNNMILTFNEDVEASALQKATYITDENDDKVKDCEITVTKVSEKNFSIAVTGLKPYTSYNLNVEGLSAINEREMNGAFTRGFVTKKASNVYVDTKDASAILNTHGMRLAKATTIDYTMVIKANTRAASNMIGAVAVYDKNDGLLAIQYKDVIVGTNTFNLTGIPLGAERVKLYVWTKDENGNIGSILHEPDTIKEENPKPEYEITYENSLPTFGNGVADSANSVLYISGKTSAQSGVYPILVLEGENTPLSDAQTKTLALVYSNVEEKDGAYVFGNTFAFNNPTGPYTAYVLTENGAISKPIKYIRATDLINEYIKPLSEGTILQSQIYQKTNEYNAAIGIDFTKDFVSARDKALFEKRMYQRRNLLTGPSTSEYVSQLMTNIQFARDEIKYLNELQKISYEGLIEDKLKLGLEYTGIDFTGYNRLNANQKSAVRSTIVGVTFADGEDLKAKFDNAVANPPSTNINNPPQTSPGFGGGGGTPTKITSDVVPPKPVVTADDVFTDMANHGWAKEAVLYLAKRNIINGVSDGKFEPAGLVTREQFAKMAVLASGIYNENASADFEDVDMTSWYAVYVASAKKKGLIDGISETEFGVGRNITRQDMAVIIYRALTESKYTFTSDRKDFADMENAADYATEAIAVLGAEGIINGYDDNTFKPTQFVTRAEAAVLIKALEEGVN